MKVKFIIYSIFFLPLLSRGQEIQSLTGKVMDSAMLLPLGNATVALKDGTAKTLTNKNGEFDLRAGGARATLLISYVGYRSKELEVSLPLREELLIYLEPQSTLLQEVVLSTGYQEIPQERATGSFVQLDSAILNRRISTDILSRLEDVVPGLVFNRNRGAGPNNISIRGQSTIFSNAQPLIVIDNFPYEGDINNINPNDVENITVLKDAAAASIWGARAGNGVIVITTKKGKFRQAPVVSFNSNFTSGNKPDLFYRPQMSTADFIDTEILLFNRGYYNSAELSAAKTPLTPVVELLIARRDGKITSQQADAEIAALKQQDVRHDLDRYFNRRSFNQQYALNLQGGTEDQRYYLSAGHDRNLSNSVGNSYNRSSVNASHTSMFARKAVEFTGGIAYSESINRQNNPGAGSLRMGPGQLLYPYARLADDQGNALPLIQDYRTSFIEQARQQGLLDWQYRPLEELELIDNNTKQRDLRLSARLRINLSNALSAEGYYQFTNDNNSTRNLHTAESYYTRNQINRFTQVGTGGVLTYPIPLGSILDVSDGGFASHNGRTQLTFRKNVNQKHDINALAGFEMRSMNGASVSDRLYGYNDQNASSRLVDYLGSYASYINPASTLIIPNNEGVSGQADRFLSYYANGSWIFKQRYTFSASGRVDRSNLFGVKTNQRGVPLYSAGVSWKVSEEPFYALAWLPELKVRFTFGYNGNINKNVTALTTADYLSGTNNALTRLPYASVTNPPNPELRWERIRIFNLGIDFRMLNGIVDGSLEFYRKQGIDLIGDTPYAPSTGITKFTGNTANTRGHGIDLNLNIRAIDREFKWHSALLFSHSRDVVSRYKIQVSASGYLNHGDAGNIVIYPLEGKPLYALYSYPWAGLDPLTGAPRGYLNGAVSQDYAKIIAASTPANLNYHGPARPRMFGALRNTFSWKNLSLSAGLSYRLGYFFRRESVNYETVLSGQGGHGDYYRRWQKPGDELLTNIPSLPALSNNNQNNFVRYSEALVLRGDHIRFQDINLAFGLPEGGRLRLPVSQTQLYVYVNNLGLLWKANKEDIDPDYDSQGPLPLTIAAGLKFNLR